MRLTKKPSSRSAAAEAAAEAIISKEFSLEADGKNKNKINNTNNNNNHQTQEQAQQELEDEEKRILAIELSRKGRRSFQQAIDDADDPKKDENGVAIVGRTISLRKSTKNKKNKKNKNNVIADIDIKNNDGDNNNNNNIEEEDEDDDRFDDDYDGDEGGGSDAPSVASDAANRMTLKNLSRNETRSIQIFKGITLLAMIVAGTLITVGGFFILQNEQDDDYNNSYDQFVRTIENAVQAHLRLLYARTEELAAHMATRAAISNQTFPFVTINDWEAMTQGVRRLTGFEVMSFVPVVQRNQLQDWERYSVQHFNDWWEPSRILARSAVANVNVTNNDNKQTAITLLQPRDYSGSGGNITPYVYEKGTREPSVEVDPVGPYLPLWQRSPPPAQLSLLNLNHHPDGVVGQAVLAARTTRQAVFGRLHDYSDIADVSLTDEAHEQFHQVLVQDQRINANNDNNVTSYDRPHCNFVQPIFAVPTTSTTTTEEEEDVVALIIARIPWDWYLINLLPEGVRGIFLVMRNSCQQSYTYEVTGNTTIYLGEGDLHDPKYDSTERIIPFYQLQHSNTTRNVPGHCLYTFYLYSSSTLEDEYKSKSPPVLTALFASTFAVMGLAFCVYDWSVRRRNEIVIEAAAKSNAIVSSLFPDAFKSRLMEDDNNDENMVGGHNIKAILKRYMIEDDDDTNVAGVIGGGGSTVRGGGGGGTHASGGGSTGKIDDMDDGFMFKTKPIADLFTETTIFFCDIAGFTSWSSTREPTQVFILLETIYKAFDDLANKRHVFKVETVGDSYVAASGIPDPRPDHVVVMARFARDCLEKFQELVKRLEVVLGPDTADLALRVGLHSGPVTAGVLRGERSRFQLFGDTMNTASRMESTGVRDKIQISQDTADLLVAAGKGKWIVPREEKVVAKGKGEMQTFWLLSKSDKDKIKQQNAIGTAMCGKGAGTAASDDISVDTMSTSDVGADMSDKVVRLVSWNVDLLMKLLRIIVAERKANTHQGGLMTRKTSVVNIIGVPSNNDHNKATAAADWTQLTSSDGKTTVLDEVKEIIHLPDFHARDTHGNNYHHKKRRAGDVHGGSDSLDPVVEEQLTEYVTAIALMYRDNPFHNFEHASHVTMAVAKFMSRIVAPELDDEKLHKFDGNVSMAAMLHDYTYGITSDPLTQFACVFSSLIHDVDHTGVPNTQLCKENEMLAKHYRGKSVAEQNSIDLAWNLLLDNKFKELRNAIAATQLEQERFRQLVVNSVMATDIMDADLKQLRNMRWERAFAENVTVIKKGKEESAKDKFDRKATIVIEHLIQASDVAHTMQHWHVYRKWNERLFEELYCAYMQGRAEKDPSEFWYKGEIGFFDFYIIPLAKKLKDCGVFGVSSSECLDYATKNRDEWINRGEQVVAEMKDRIAQAYQKPQAGMAGLPRNGVGL